MSNRVFRLNNIPAFIIFALQLAVVYFICFALMQDPVISIFIALGVYLLLFLLLLCPAGEFITRLLCGATRIERSDWLAKLNIVNDTVVKKAIEEDQNITDIKFYMYNDPLPNAISAGRRTILLSSGLLEMDTTTIQGIVAHEIGHISCLDATIFTVVNVGNMLVSVVGLFMQSLILFANLTDRLLRRGRRDLLRDIILLIPILIVLMIVSLSRLVLNAGCRSKDYAADAYAVKLGYGRQLREALLATDFESQTSRLSLTNMMTGPRPPVHIRVGRIDTLLNDNSSGGASGNGVESPDDFFDNLIS